ncbi:MAG: radical SAM protein [Eggerthellaceae bacterium]|nr:radical SAM protein [Eggerthellaceae bacterium]
MVDYMCSDPEEHIVKIVDMLNTLVPPNLFPSQRKAFKRVIENKDNMYELIMRILHLNPEVRSSLIKTVRVDGNLIAWGFEDMMRYQYKCNIPWAILLDPTSACNLHCTGCWAAEYGHQLNMSFDDINSIIEQGKKLGVYIYIYTGGEPMVRKKDIIKLCEMHPDCAFLCFTNATLIDEDFCKDMLRVKNFIPAISAEGDEAATDGRRGEGVYKKVEHAMDLLHENGLPFGISICYTHENAASISNMEYMDYLIDKGALFAWIFTYMPVGKDAHTELMLTAEDRENLYHFTREVRTTKPIFILDFQNDGEYVGGCIAGGRRYLHINAAGDVEPCVFIHYSNYNIHDHTLLECLQSPLFMEYYNEQPFNENLLRPCPMLENPDCIEVMVTRSGAHSTDLQAPESAHELAEKCRPMAEQWAPEAERLWMDENDPQNTLRQRQYQGMSEADVDKIEREGRVLHGANDPNRPKEAPLTVLYEEHVHYEEVPEATAVEQ